MSDPKISVIMPVYNSEQYLAESLNSFMAQTLQDIEIICVDDGSEDSSLMILKEYHEKDKRIKVLSQINQGAGPARNKGMLIAQGEYICFLDSDDFYPNSDTLEKLYIKAIQNKALICGGSFSDFTVSGELNTNYDQEMFWGYTFKEEGWIEYRDYQFDYGYHRFLYDRDMLIQYNIFFPCLRRFQDPPFFVQAMVQAGRFYAIPEVTYRYRSVDKTVLIQTSKEKTRDLLLGLSMNLEFAQKNNLQRLFDLTVKRCIRNYNKVFIAATEMNDDEINTILSKLNIIASEVNTDHPNVFFQMQITNEVLEKKNRAFQNEIIALQNKVSVLQNDIAHVHNSISFRIGRSLTWLPRKVCSGMRYCREHEAGYIFHRMLYYIGVWKDEGNG